MAKRARGDLRGEVVVRNATHRPLERDRDARGGLDDVQLAFEDEGAFFVGALDETANASLPSDLLREALVAEPRGKRTAPDAPRSLLQRDARPEEEGGDAIADGLAEFLGEAQVWRRMPLVRTICSRSAKRWASARTSAPVQPERPRPSFIVV